MTPGKWVASRKKNARTGSHTVHWQQETGMALCGRQLIRTQPLDEWNPHNPETCKTCLEWYKFIERNKYRTPATIPNLPQPTGNAPV